MKSIFTTTNFEIWLNEQKTLGYFEHNRAGEDYAGRLWLDKDGETGHLVLVDYDGVFALPNEIIDALLEMGIDVSYLDEEE